MIGARVDTKGIFSKIEKTRVRTRRTAEAILIEGFDAAVAITPEDTGFLRASWYVTVDGSPADHPAQPDEGRKQELDYQRIFRYVGQRNVPISAKAYNEGEPGLRSEADPRPDPEFVAIYQSREAVRAVFDMGFSSRSFAGHIRFLNNAPYANMSFHAVDDLQPVAIAAARVAMKGKAASLKATPAARVRNAVRGR